MTARPPFDVQERDVDLPILEQAHVSPSVLAWTAGRTGLVGARLESGRHGVHRDHGGADVLLVLRVGEGRVALMIEDKVGAPLQPRQGERRHERGRDLTARCAPRSYLAGVAPDAPWQARLPFEDPEARVAADPSPAAAWRRAMSAAAASKAARARQTDDPAVVALRAADRPLVKARRPDLVATPQTGRDREHVLKARSLPSGLRLKHAVFRGEVSLILERR